MITNPFLRFSKLTHSFVPKSPESDVLAKCFADTGEKCGENLAKNFADSHPGFLQYPGKLAARNFTKKFSANSTGHDMKFFHRETPEAWGHKILSHNLSALRAGVLS